MYIGSTAKERPDHFVVIESGDSATDILALMEEKQVFNLILDGKTFDANIFELPEFKEVFENINITYLSNFNIDKNEILYALKNAIRLEIKKCTYKGKERIDWSVFTRLEEVFTLYSKRFVNLFTHPTLKTIFIEKFTEENYRFPKNGIINTFSIEGSVSCDWSTLTHFNKLEALYLSEIKSLTDISWLVELNNLKELDISLCKNAKAITEAISTIKTLKYLHIFQSGVIESIQSLASLTNLEELTIENKGKLSDKNISFLDKISNLEYSIEIGSFGATSDK
ncbi:protein phosphatase 1 regulatory subunit 42 [Elizabethkingia meningoseptica]|uniref:protein phosphatase 1 regulatory subunit 42 n=1 Tax=Elizabethkingia meningoseptica TaxID=238 RepID=UPI0020124F18|nr:protein phosphatase 1 regulatory subunit 42 [Elizabethkingia meningoseptica]MCL1674927.1 protein phosphatase 1 regulatory subunit 42 [Elizabethkingia meningoseptica]MCL1685705.1 protein phosphatase 1 regulatory subunit 42 [Elizabethkingia meningoseptica]